jgi:signal recognition particle GTPase
MDSYTNLSKFGTNSEWREKIKNNYISQMQGINEILIDINKKMDELTGKINQLNSRLDYIEKKLIKKDIPIEIATKMLKLKNKYSL